MRYDEDSPNQRGTPYVQGLFGRRDREGANQAQESHGLCHLP